MNRRYPDPGVRAPDSPPGEGLLRRWLRRKQTVRAEAAARERESDGTTERESRMASDTDVPELPPLESLDADSDYSGFLHPQVDDALRQAALRKLFRSAKFNVVDGLDDYAEDYRSFEALGDVITADLRHQREREALRRRALERAQAPDDEFEASARPAEPTPAEPAPVEPPTTAASRGMPTGDT